jgi:hypothetical protein
MPGKSYKSLQKNITSAIERTGYQFALPDLEAMGRNIDQVATANPMLAAAIRAIIKNVNQPILRVWDKKAEKDATPDILNLLIAPNVVQDYSSFVKFNFSTCLMAIPTFAKCAMAKKSWPCCRFHMPI